MVVYVVRPSIHIFPLLLLSNMQRGQLASTIEKLMEQRGQFDYILIECSGLADPG